MEYYNIVLFILIFIILLVVFYLIISNFNLLNSKATSSDDVVELEKKLFVLKTELSNIKSNSPDNSNQITQVPLTNQIVPLPSEQNTIKEIIIENGTDNPTNTINIPNSSSQTNPNTNSQCTGNYCSKPPPVIFDPIANYDIAKLTDPLVDPRGRTSADQIPTPQVAAQFNFPTQGVLDRYHRVGLLIAIGSDVKKESKLSKKFGIPYANSDSESYSDSESNTGLNFVWKGPSKTKKNKKKNIPESGTITAKSYRGVEIKEGFESGFDSDSGFDLDSDLDSDSVEYFGNTDKSVTNIYNVYSNPTDNNVLELIGKKVTDNWYKYFTSITMGNKVIKVVVKNKNRRELYSGDIVFIPEINKTYRVKIDPMDMIEYNPYMF